jgi:hypothetical protein
MSETGLSFDYPMLSSVRKDCGPPSGGTTREGAMPQGLERIVYVSEARGSTDSLLNLAAILAESQRNNARDGLTGALAAHDGRFLQVLEGSPHAIDSLLRRLEKDRRHHDIQVLEREPIAERRFGDWSMAAARITPGLAPLLADVMAGVWTRPAETLTQMEQAALAA